MLAEAFDDHHHLKKAILIGNHLTEKEKYTLYLANNDRPLSVSGKTIIKGKAFLPSAGIRKAYIEGQSYQGARTIDGIIETSFSSLNPLHTQGLQYLFELLQNSSQTDKIINHLNLNDSLINSFFEITRFVQLEDSTLTGKFKGNIIINSEKPITIKKGAQLEDILIFAPSVRIENEFIGQLQIFASDSIIVGEKCTLNYPSALGLLRKENELPQDNQPFIHLEKGSIINGTVFSYYDGKKGLKNLINIDSETLVNGQVYADGFLQLQGRINGNTQCDLFYLKTESTLYENFILNGEMDFSTLSPYYVGNPLLNQGTLFSIIKWLM